MHAKNIGMHVQREFCLTWYIHSTEVQLSAFASSSAVYGMKLELLDPK